MEDQTIYDGIYPGGRKIITFANILEHDVFPLANILSEVLSVSQLEMSRPVEIEFAVNLDYSSEKATSVLLIANQTHNRQQRIYKRRYRLDLVGGEQPLQALPVQNVALDEGDGLAGDLLDPPEGFGEELERLSSTTTCWPAPSDSTRVWEPVNNRHHP